MKKPVRLNVVLPLVIVPIMSLLVLLLVPREREPPLQKTIHAPSALGRLTISDTSVGPRDPGSSGLAMNLTVRNATGSTLSRVDFAWQYVTLDREVPWAEGTLACNIPGGLENGEVQQWKLAPYELHAAHFQMEGFLVILPIRLEDARGNVLEEDTAFGSARGRSTASPL